MKDDHISIEFSGTEMGEIISKMISFRNMFKGISLGESGGQHEQGRKNPMAQGTPR